MNKLAKAMKIDNIASTPKSEGASMRAKMIEIKKPKPCRANNSNALQLSALLTFLFSTKAYLHSI